MSVENPTNCWTEAEANIAVALANSSAFRDLCGVEDAASAANHICGEELARPSDGHVYTVEELIRMRAYGQVYSADESPYGKRHDGSRYVPFGTAIVYLQYWPIVAEFRGHSQCPLKLERKFKNRTGDIIDELVEYLQENSGPFIQDIEILAGPGTNDPDKWESAGMCMELGYALAWGYAG